MKKWKKFERECCKRVCEIFDEPYIAFQRNQQHREIGSCRTPQRHPGSDLLKSERLKALFPFSMEIKTEKQFHTSKFIDWILQSINQTPTDEHPLLVIHKHNSRISVSILETEIFLEYIEDISAQAEFEFFKYYGKKFSTKVFWNAIQEAEENSFKKNYAIHFYTDRIIQQIPPISLTIINFDIFLDVVKRRYEKEIMEVEE